MSEFCTKPVRDGADGGEFCGEPLVTPGVNACYDHAHACEVCGEPTDHNQNFCPTHLQGMKTNQQTRVRR